MTGRLVSSPCSCPQSGQGAEPRGTSAPHSLQTGARLAAATGRPARRAGEARACGVHGDAALSTERKRVRHGIRNRAEDDHPLVFLVLAVPVAVAIPVPVSVAGQVRVEFGFDLCRALTRRTDPEAVTLLGCHVLESEHPEDV